MWWDLKTVTGFLVTMMIQTLDRSLALYGSHRVHGAWIKTRVCLGLEFVQGVQYRQI